MAFSGVLLIILAFFSSVVSAKALPSIDDKLCAGIHLSEEASWPPFTEEASGVATKGLSFDLMNLVFKKLGCKIDINLLPQARLIESAKSGSIDGVTAISKNSDREKFLVYSERPLLVRKAYIYYLKGRTRPIEFHSWENLKELQLGIVTGSNYSKDFETARAAAPLKVTEVVSTAQLFEMTLRGHIDAFPAMDLVGREFLSLPEYKDKFVHSKEAYDSYSYYFAVPEKSPLIKYFPQINKTIKQLLFDGEIAEVLKKYGL